MSYFQVVKDARKRFEDDRLSVLVLGSTYGDCDKPYPTRELKQYLESIGHNASLAEDNIEDISQEPANLPAKVLEMAKDCDAIVCLVCNIGGVPSEIPFMVHLHPSKTFFFIRKGDELGKMINGFLCGHHLMKDDYETKEELFEKTNNCLKSHKLTVRMKRAVAG